jgi:hypothetical protein
MVIHICLESWAWGMGHWALEEKFSSFAMRPGAWESCTLIYEKTLMRLRVLCEKPNLSRYQVEPGNEGGVNSLMT